MQIFPQQNFTIVRQIADHTDVAIYYVRAVVRNAFTDDIIATLDLDSKGSQRYKKDWHVPADRSGQGTWISIVTSVYEDSGYTTKSSLYGDEESSHLILARNNTSSGGGGMRGGSNLSIRDIKDAVREVVIENKPKKIKIPNLKDIEFPEQEPIEMRWDEVLKSISDLNKAISKLPQEKTNLDPITEMLVNIKNQIGSIDIPELNLTPIVVEMKKNRKQNSIQNERILTLIKSLIKKLPTMIADIFKKVFNDSNFITSSVTFIGDKKPMMHKLELGEEKIEEKKIKGFNLSELSK